MGKTDAAAVVSRSGSLEETAAGLSLGRGRGWRRIWSGLVPALVLLLLAPAEAEVLFWATPVSNLGALLPDVAVYGCGALLIREVVRRRGLGWASILALDVAFGIVEEGLALGSLFNPNLFNAGIWVVGRWGSTGCGRSGR